jgi:hypothetical protein
VSTIFVYFRAKSQSEDNISFTFSSPPTPRQKSTRQHPSLITLPILDPHTHNYSADEMVQEAPSRKRKRPLRIIEAQTNQLTTPEAAMGANCSAASAAFLSSDPTRPVASNGLATSTCPFPASQPAQAAASYLPRDQTPHRPGCPAQYSGDPPILARMLGSVAAG